MGARAILDTAIIETVTDHGTFGKNLQAMKDKGYLSEKNCEYLEVAFDAGSASVHRSHNPDEDQINTVMDIVENMPVPADISRLAVKLPYRKDPSRPNDVFLQCH